MSVEWRTVGQCFEWQLGSAVRDGDQGAVLGMALGEARAEPER